MHEFCKNNIIGSEFWVNSASLTFKEIQDSSFMPYKYQEYSIVSNQFKDNLLSPINGYALDFSPKPKVVKVEENVVTFRQLTHAEIWVEPKENGLYSLDKCHQRQFYPSNSNNKIDQCFEANYRFYMPWFVKTKSPVTVSTIKDTFSPFVIEEKTMENLVVKDSDIFIEPIFVNFLIKKEGAHMHNNRYGIIEIESPMYDFSVQLEDKELDKINV